MAPICFRWLLPILLLASIPLQIGGDRVQWLGPALSPQRSVYFPGKMAARKGSAHRYAQLSRWRPFPKFGREKAAPRRVWMRAEEKDELDPTAKIEREKKQKEREIFIVEKGKFVDTIRSELPHLLRRDLNLEMLRDDVKLHIILQQLGINTKLTGIGSYNAWFRGLRWSSKALWDYSTIAPIIIRKELDPMCQTVTIRWSVRAHAWLSTEPGFPVRIDLVSTFLLDESGKIQEHCIRDTEPPRQIFDEGSKAAFQSLSNLVVPDQPRPPVVQAKQDRVDVHCDDSIEAAPKGSGDDDLRNNAHSSSSSATETRARRGQRSK